MIFFNNKGFWWEFSKDFGVKRSCHDIRSTSYLFIYQITLIVWIWILFFKQKNAVLIFKPVIKAATNYKFRIAFSDETRVFEKVPRKPLIAIESKIDFNFKSWIFLLQNMKQRVTKWPFEALKRQDVFQQFILTNMSGLNPESHNCNFIVFPNVSVST